MKYDSKIKDSVSSDISIDSDMDQKHVLDLMKTDYNYPKPGDPEFQRKIYEKREFNFHKMPSREHIKTYEDVKKFRDIHCSPNFALYSHQNFLANMMNPDTIYKGLLVTHGLGSGKSISAIAVAEQFKSMVQKYGTKIHVLVPGPVIREVWKEQLIKGTKETYMKPHDRSSLMDEAEYQRQKKMALNTAMQFYRFMSYRSFSKRVLGERIIERRHGESKEKSKYRKSDGEFERDMPVDRIHTLNNTLIIVDEAHNLTGNDYGAALVEITKRSKNLRIILLTATPMKNLADDIIELINFIRPHDKPVLRDHVFTSQGGHLMELREGGLEYLKKMCRGYVSYLRGADPMTFATRVDIGDVPPGLKFTKVISSQLYPFQRSCYDEAIKDEGDALSKKSEAVANFVVPGLSPDKKTIVGYYGREGIQLVCNQLKSQAAILNQRINENMPGWLKNLPECKDMNSTQIKALIENNHQEDWIRLAEGGKTFTGRILRMPFLRIFSTKFADALDGIGQRVEGKRGAMTSFCYSNLVKAGIELFQEVLLENGFIEFDEGGSYQIRPTTICYRCGKENKGHQAEHAFKPATFITVTGKSTDDVAEYIPEDKQRVIRAVFNSLNNVDGRDIKCILGSRVMNEGVSLENLGEIDILDVYFNFGRVDQVVGRGIRNCSHYKVINDDNKYPYVNVYKFCICVGEGSAETGDYKLSSEEELYQKAELKYLLIKRVERCLKEVAVDCALNRNGNIFPEEVEKHRGCSARGDCPALCDYMECEFKCDDPELNAKWLDKNGNYVNIPKAQLDYTTFTSRLSRDEIDFAKERIKDMYRLSPQYKLANIVSYVRKGYTQQQHINLFDEMFVFRALDELLPKTENDFNNFRDSVLDPMGNIGYLIHRGEYYIFQPMNQTEDVPMYYRTNFAQTMNHKLSLYNYMQHTIDWATVEKITDEQNEEADEKHEDKDGYDFESVRDYYETKEEYGIVGILDKDTGRGKVADGGHDVFKIRPKREKILDKRRGTGITSYKGSVCSTSKSREYLDDVVRKVGAKIKLEPTTSRLEICNSIQDRLIELEKYGTSGTTYIIVPANHSVYKFPINLQDRVKITTDTIKSSMKGSQVTVEKDKPDEDKFIRKYTITVKPHGVGSDKVLKELGFIKEKTGDEWSMVVE
jgi:DNA polymerase III delta prime subunit